MSVLILIKHSLPEILPSVPAYQWRLSPEGRQRCLRLAERLKDHHPDILVTSNEPKAVETGQIVAQQLNLSWETAPGLEEHDRSSGAGWFEDPSAFRAAVADLFARPGELVFGGETADQAHRRFSQAVARVVSTHPDETLAIVTHGTVLTLLVSRANQLDPFSFWQQLDLPSFVELTWPDLDLVSTTYHI